MSVGAESEVLVRLSAVTHKFSKEGPLFRPISLDLRSGTVYALLGPSGSGKSTLLGILAGQIRPSDGMVKRNAELSVGWVFQNPVGSARRTALDHVALPLLGKGLSRNEANQHAVRILARFGLSAQKRTDFRHLSGGEAQRLLLARAVAFSPDILLVDEPTAQLDLRAARKVNDVLAEIGMKGSVVVVATHDPLTAERCDVRIELALP
ncbi:ATP-binding cassette domain-containing protein [Rathayibacter sp. VKM Ac-2803]|uniref:ABC transporter ATP-binding protein n=1 Tax=unclassified Rathayibacter TaxID=2609250 RepID=UPI00135841C0|nr:ATP-binding cassette domain-containing protein [Rathayibacter sp. VKM Ac-2803]MWV47886.1 ATP-binding cassette domain-containing protein [Rathayibacter sp. VKM Ac-2803]MWV58899.1 ATP-binding cassette domain-containing protein [Rathayibacter sp. VKM Ac-2754]